MVEQHNFALGYPETLQDRRAQPDTLLQYGAILGVILLVGAGIWVGLLRGRNLWDEWFQADLIQIVGDIGVGLSLGGMFALVLWQFGQRYRGFAVIRQRLVETLDLANFTWKHNFLLAMIAAIPEEVFFRGTIQPVFGFFLTALIFGALHSLTLTYFIYALIAGLGLGMLAEWHETLWLPMAAHFAIDYVSLIILSHWARNLPVRKSSKVI